MNKISRILGAVRSQIATYVPRVSAATQASPATSSPTSEMVKKDEPPAVKSQPHEGLMEFFDVKDNWSLNEVKVGRSWRKEELRIKSNQDLHKLWYVLLKERNMLLTMQHEFLELFDSFPSPERIDKVHESMVNVEEVVRERNRAYYLLETGETGERPGRVTTTRLGLTSFYRMQERFVPPENSIAWFIKARGVGCHRLETAKFRLLYNEQVWLSRRRARNRAVRHVMGLYKRFPNLDEDAVREEYPEVDLEKIKRWNKAQGHFLPRNL